ncbi:MAG: ATP-binding cassette domain-containing protein [Propionibacteriaceae bacterium]|nr:ATP-binding cassette domain-containing protein [Propionibacteriaceae bacterium]
MRVEVTHLTKRFGRLKAVDDLSFTVEPGRITGFLGPNGAGKTTTLRAALQLVNPTSGAVTFEGQRYSEIRHPMRLIGAGLEASSFYPGRSALDHLRTIAPLVGVNTSRCRVALDSVGLGNVMNKPVGQFSLGMRGRLELAVTLLGKPRVLLLDEPSNGLDPEGIAWMRTLLRDQADQGTAVLVSSHVLSEVEQTVDDVVIIAKGRLVHASSLEQLSVLASSRTLVTPVRSSAFRALADGHSWRYSITQDGFEVENVAAADIGHAAFIAGVELHQLRSDHKTLEQMFFEMTESAGAIS